MTLEPSGLADLREEVGQLREQLRAAQERLSAEDHRGSLAQRSLRCVKYGLNRMKEAQRNRSSDTNWRISSKSSARSTMSEDANSHARNTLYNCAKMSPSGLRRQ
jgi:hypothetical protein